MKDIKERKPLAWIYRTIIRSTDSYYTCNKQVLWESVGSFFPRDNSRFRPQVA